MNKYPTATEVAYNAIVKINKRNRQIENLKKKILQLEAEKSQITKMYNSLVDSHNDLYGDSDYRTKI